MTLRGLLRGAIIAGFLGQGIAAAGPVRVVAGGPRAKGERARVMRSLSGYADTLGVCWRGDRPATVTIDLVVGADGRVVESRQKTPGPAAQCAAGILAVQMLEAVGARYTVSAAFDTGAGTAGSIQDALEPYRDKLYGCHGKTSGHTQVVLRFRIHPDGRITEAVVQPARTDADLRRCLVDTIQGTRLGTDVTSKPVTYSLRLDMAGGSKQAATASAARAGQAGPALQPRKDGPMAGADISAVMTKRKSDFSACYNAQARRDRSLAGQVLLRFTIRDNGTVQNVKVRETTLGNAAVERCIVKVGESLRFQAQPGRAPTKVWYPFSFTQ